MFVIDLIEGGLRDDVAPVRILDDARAVRRQQDRDAFDDRMQVGDMRQRIGGDDRVGVAMLGNDVPRRRHIEEPAHSVDAASARRPAPRWLTARCRDDEFPRRAA